MIPRWIVYFQGALLGVVAATFFVFGVMVGNLTSGTDSAAEQKLNCRLSGQVVVSDRNDTIADRGAVVMLLPLEFRPEERSNSALLHPESFEPLENPGIDRIMALGGAVVRVNDRGAFDVTVDGPHDYVLLVVSASQTRDGSTELSKNQKAVLANYFLPAEGVIGQQAFYWSKLTADRESVELSKIEF